eukprot:6323973-Amphidinium_carterae.1
MEIVVSQEEYTDPNVNKLILIGALVLDTHKLCQAGERLAGWPYDVREGQTSSHPSGLTATRGDTRPPQDAGIEELQHALGAGAAEAAPDEMLSREELVKQLELARLDSKRAKDHEEGKRRGERPNASRIGQVLVEKVVSNEAGASLAVKGKRPASHTLLRAGNHKRWPDLLQASWHMHT